MQTISTIISIEFLCFKVIAIIYNNLFLFIIKHNFKLFEL